MIAIPGDIGVPPCASPREGADPMTPGSAPDRVARLLGWLSSAVLAASLVGCAGAGRVDPSAIRPPGSFDASSATSRTGQVPALPLVELDRWWLAFDDPELTALIEAAQARSGEVRAAEARLRESVAVRDGALGRFGVQAEAGLTGRATRTEVLRSSPIELDGQSLESSTFTPGGTSVSTGASFNVSWELDLFGRRGATRAAADADLAAARFEREAVAASTAAQVADALFEARALVVQAADARETGRLRAGIAATVAERLARGLAATGDARRARADEGAAAAEVERLEGALAASLRAIRLLSGEAFVPVGDWRPAALGAVPAIPATLPIDLLARRPDIRRADAAFRAEAARLRLQNLELAPRLLFQPGATIDASGGALGQSTAVGFLGLGLTVPLLDGGRLRAAARVQRVRAEGARVAYERSVEEAFVEVGRVAVELAADRRRVVMLDAAVADARADFDGVRERYRRGLVDLIAVREAEASAITRRGEAVAARASLARRTVQLAKALGGGWASTRGE